MFALVDVKLFAERVNDAIEYYKKRLAKYKV